jgi:hypothetical protein
MKISTLKWINVLGVALLAVVLALVILTLTMRAETLFASVGWHELASVGWVT